MSTLQLASHWFTLQIPKTAGEGQGESQEWRCNQGHLQEWQEQNLVITPLPPSRSALPGSWTHEQEVNMELRNLYGENLNHCVKGWTKYHQKKKKKPVLVDVLHCISGFKKGEKNSFSEK